MTKVKKSVIIKPLKHFMFCALLIMCCLGCHRMNFCYKTKLMLNYYSSHFSAEQLKIIEDSLPCRHSTLITPIQIHEKKVIGLYGLLCDRGSFVVFGKVLKHEDKLVFFIIADEDANINAVDEFTNRYSRYFSRRQKRKIKESFMKGNETSGGNRL